jgi:hypothetical protein
MHFDVFDVCRDSHSGSSPLEEEDELRRIAWACCWIQARRRWKAWGAEEAVETGMEPVRSYLRFVRRLIRGGLFADVPAINLLL